MNQTYIAILIGVGAGIILLISILIKGSRVPQKHAGNELEAVCPKPAASQSVDFSYYPGGPEGYAAFTDYHAMLQAITDDIVDHDADWQFETLGFARGFLITVLARTGDLENARHVFRVLDTKEGDAAAIGWMCLMQTEGTDNASPSTSNLKSMVERVASEISTTGPYRVKYWDKAPEGQNENLAEAGISSERLLELRNLMQNAERRGELLGTSAQIMPVNFAGA
jgi:hypothetical protein